MSETIASPVTSTVTSKDGTTIAYEVSGSGPALVLVDGALCYRDFGPGRDVAAALSGEYTVYVYDRRGRGDSGDTSPYATAREVEDLAAVIGAAGGDAFVMGQSSGAALGLNAAATGVAMRKLAVYEAPYVGAKKVKGAAVDHVAELNRLLAEGNRGGAVGYFMVKMVGGPWFLPIMMRLMPKVWKQLQAVATTLPNDATIMDGFEVPAALLAKVKVPTLVMGGGKAAPNMAAAVQGVADAVAGSTLVILPGQTHQVSPAVLVPELAKFFR